MRATVERPCAGTGKTSRNGPQNEGAPKKFVTANTRKSVMWTRKRERKAR